MTAQRACRKDRQLLDGVKAFTPNAARTLLDPACDSRLPGVQGRAEQWSLGLTKECRSIPRHTIGRI